MAVFLCVNGMQAKDTKVFQSLMGMRASLEDSENPVIIKTLDIQDAIQSRFQRVC